MVFRPAKRPVRLTLLSFNYSGTNRWKYKLWGNCGSVVSAVTRLRAGRAWVRVTTRQGICLSPIRSKPDPRAYITPYSMGTAGCEADSSPLYNAEGKNEWSYTSTLCLEGMARENFTCTLYKLWRSGNIFKIAETLYSIVSPVLCCWTAHVTVAVCCFPLLILSTRHACTVRVYNLTLRRVHATTVALEK